MSVAVLIVHPCLKRFKNGSGTGGFEWMEQHQMYAWEGRELTVEEFEKVWVDVAQRHAATYGRILIPKIIEKLDVPVMDLKAKRQANAKHAREVRLRKLRQAKKRTLSSTSFAEHLFGDTSP